MSFPTKAIVSLLGCSHPRSVLTCLVLLPPPPRPNSPSVHTKHADAVEVVGVAEANQANGDKVVQEHDPEVGQLIVHKCVQQNPRKIVRELKEVVALQDERLLLTVRTAAPSKQNPRTADKNPPKRNGCVR